MVDSDSNDVDASQAMSPSKKEVADLRPKTAALDITDHNDELDYEEDEENEKKVSNNKGNTGDESEGEIVEKTTTGKKKYRRQETSQDKEEGEENTSSEEDDDTTHRDKSEREKFVATTKGSAKTEDINKKEEEPKSEEEGEINDGEKVKKAFIPRVLCKYYQRGKCSWGRNCKFLHPGVNDTGNYNFLEYQDPNAKVFQQQTAPQPSNDIDSQNAAPISTESNQPIQTESAWERGLRHAKEMKERAMRRKQMEKDQFDDKKMNLSLKDFENENDERYINAERPTNADEEQEDEEIRAYASRLNRPSNNQESREANEDRSYPSGYNKPSNFRHPYEAVGDKSKGDLESRSKATGGAKGFEQRRPVSPLHRAAKSRPDEWHDPWDRSRQTKKGATTLAGNQRRTPNSYSSSDSESESRSRSRSRSSYSSKSSYSSRSSQDSNRSNSHVARNRTKTVDQKRKATGHKATAKSVVGSVASTGNKSLPGRGVSDFSLKKASIPTSSLTTAATTRKKRSRSNSSASSYSSSSSSSKSEVSDDESSSSSKSGASSSQSSEESDDESNKTDENEDEDFRKPSTKKPVKSAVTVAQKRPAGKDSKAASNLKKPKTSNSPTKSKDKKQLIKDQLKLLESALKKKAMSK